ncbi:EAL domain-containing protein [Rhizobium sp. RU20A]|uniref:putative bifunctional diguanylate cyclase/phosphodiesterase n=1 Tax=Rhizobium sp. RU20A TaxID=1907412 RepID=UPI00165F6028|nr:EAL domain-containing protein [Rhizobium sp. RU20A]
MFFIGAGLWPSAIDTPLALGFDLTVGLLPLATTASGYRLGLLRRRVAAARRGRAQNAALLSDKAFIDPLTGLANREALERAVNAILAGDTAVGRNDGLILLDLDRFGHVNETIGRAAGDQILLILAQRLRQALGAHASLFRPGGNEFVVLVPGTPSRGKLEDIARIVGGVLREPFELSGGQLWIGGSLGVTFVKADDTQLSDILSRADLALRRSKEMVGNSVTFHEEGLSTQTQSLRAAGRDIQQALDEDAFFLEYQPVIGVESGRIRAMEALVRWRDAEHGALKPDDFLVQAERTGAMPALGRWILKTACREAAGWPEDVGVSVNVSKHEIGAESFVDFVALCLREAGLQPSRLTIEVTDAVFSPDPKRIATVFSALRRMGVRVALDDFGVGFSAVCNLGLFPIDQIKIDRSFTDAMMRSRRDGELLDLILKTVASFKIPAIIEGVETECQLEVVRALGASEVQGYLISPPVPAGEVGALLAAFKAPGACASAA